MMPEIIDIEGNTKLGYFLPGASYEQTEVTNFARYLRTANINEVVFLGLRPTRTTVNFVQVCTQMGCEVQFYYPFMSEKKLQQYSPDRRCLKHLSKMDRVQMHMIHAPLFQAVELNAFEDSYPRLILFYPNPEPLLAALKGWGVYYPDMATDAKALKGEKYDVEELASTGSLLANLWTYFIPPTAMGLERHLDETNRALVAFLEQLETYLNGEPVNLRPYIRRAKQTLELKENIPVYKQSAGNLKVVSFDFRHVQTPGGVFVPEHRLRDPNMAFNVFIYDAVAVIERNFGLQHLDLRSVDKHIEVHGGKRGPLPYRLEISTKHLERFLDELHRYVVDSKPRQQVHA